jgi:hypothetical protein
MQLQTRHASLGRSLILQQRSHKGENVNEAEICMQMRFDSCCHAYHQRTLMVPD